VRHVAAVIAGLLSIAYSIDAMAYVGPGLGAGALAAVLGVAGGILMLVVGVVWYPIKRVIRRFRERK
jgi:hypothetical protein